MTGSPKIEPVQVFWSLHCLSGQAYVNCVLIEDLGMHLVNTAIGELLRRLTLNPNCRHKATREPPSRRFRGFRCLATSHGGPGGTRTHTLQIKSPLRGFSLVRDISQKPSRPGLLLFLVLVMFQHFAPAARTTRGP